MLQTLSYLRTSLPQMNTLKQNDLQCISDKHKYKIMVSDWVGKKAAVNITLTDMSF